MVKEDHNHWQKQHEWFTKLCDRYGEALTMKELRQFDDEFWFWMHTEGYRENHVLKGLLSPLPDCKVQICLTGVSGDLSLRHGFNQYMIIKELLEKNGKQLSDFKRILDFGCGYGRILRFFTKDCVHSELYGTDIDKGLIAWCKQENKFGKYYLNEVSPPTQFEDGMFDFVFSFSVFTHLSERSHLQWLEEMYRILKRGGMLAFTVWEHPTRTIEYHGPHFPNYARLSDDYDKGKYCYSNHLYQGSEIYGEALIPISYIVDNWSKYFEVLDYTDNHPWSPTQKHILLRKV